MRSSNFKAVLFQTIQFSIRAHFSFIWPIDRTLSGATTPDKSGPGSDGNKGILRIPQSSSSTWALPSDYLVSYLGHSLVGCWLFEFHGTSTTMGYSMPNPAYILLWSSDKTGGRTTQTTVDTGTLLYKQKKGSHTKEVLAVLGLQSVYQMSRKKRDVVFPEWATSENMFRLDVSIFGVWYDMSL